ncbi:MAG: two component signal transduction system hydrid histidine kinase / response regulator with GAF and P [Roseibaca calidilacus]|uniref:histidine kinase n=2 Tax=Roseibaca calidilacus TaxID=1666912 RepID=A0A0P8AEV3_9RHOB|nr:MAG: two component signal transduction system hydrid histidine kinase / response regulator with GAF and P [Roseibaca calidilacus]CUX80152.1 PAS domain S-box-containing protein [Roseibaca calidilacus]
MPDRGNEQRLTEIQALVVTLINRLLSASVEHVDGAVQDGLAQLGTFTGRDRAYVFMIQGDRGSNTHEWCSDQTEPMIAQLQDLPVEAFEWMLEPISSGRAFHLPDIDELPPDSEKYEFLSQQGIRSLLIVPMIDEEDLVGFVGFDSVNNVGKFLPGEIYLLRSFADVVRSVLMRRKTTIEMRRAEEELARERAFLKGIVSTNAAGFVVLSETGEIVYANDEAERVLGVSVDEMIGQKYNAPQWRITDIKGRAVPDEREPFSIVKRTGAMVQNHRIALHCPDGVRYASINAAPISRGGVEVASVVYSVTDVTGLVKAEQARETALQEAHRANIAKSNFLAKMSHEIRTPLNGILGISDILEEMTSDPAQMRMLDILRDSGGLLMGIINDLLDMSKIEADALELDSTPFSLTDLARRTEEVHTLRASEKRLSFAVKINDPLGQDRLGDPQRLTQILHNMISNAIKFTEYGHVLVDINAPDEHSVIVTVEDTGIGMTEAQHARMFDPFAQADSTISRRFGGTGLGMSIVRNLVDLMGGTIQTKTAPDVGTTISVTLPIPLAPVDVQARALSVANVDTSRSLPELSILAADDNRTNQMILSIMLGQLGARVTLANDGLDALQKSRAERFDLMILDISMPGMDGVTVLNTIRRDEKRAGLAQTPAFAFTANAMSHQVESYLQAGFDACLTKPLKLERLHHTLLDFFADNPVSQAALPSRK